MTVVTPPQSRPGRHAPAAARHARREPIGGLLVRAGYEFLQSAGVLFTVLSAVRWLFAPASPLARHIPEIQAKLAVMGILIGLVILVAFATPLGKQSGAHLNPAITVGLWRLGLFPGRGVVPYVSAQLAGSLAGVGLARLVWGTAIAAPPVTDAALAPAPGWSAGALFATEFSYTAGLMLVVSLLLSRRLMRFLPLAIAVYVAMVVGLYGPLSGGGANPARQLGPALFSGRTGYLWVYLCAPVAGALAGAALATALRRPHPHPRRSPGRITHKTSRE